MIKNKGQYSFGDQITFADCFLVPMIFTTERFHVDMTSYKNIMAVNEACLALDAFKKAHPGRQIDTPESDRISL